MKRGVKEYLLELKLINHCDQSLFILDQGVWERLNLVYFSLSLSPFLKKRSGGALATAVTKVFLRES
jgi:hypothetical protein